MRNKENDRHAREAKQAMNQNLKQQVEAADRELKTAREQYEHVKLEHVQLSSQYDAIKQGSIWRIVTSMHKIKRMLQLYMKYMLGKRDRREIFDRSLRKRKAKNKIKKLKYNLYDLGFTEKALAELTKESKTSDNPYTRRYAAWELALMYANQYNKEGAEKCLTFLSQAEKRVKNRDFLRRLAILKAESYDIIGRVTEAKDVISHALASQKHADLYLARANLETSFTERVKWMNKALKLYGIQELDRHAVIGKTCYDRLRTKNQKNVELIDNTKEKVTIIVPAYNAEDGIRTTLDSLLVQTWTNLEIIVADDQSTDNTINIVKEYSKIDPRVQIISTKTNSGAYTARNEALKIATGDFVTINDADDWSHPQKMEEQVKHFIENPSVIANTTQQARATESLKFFRRGKPGEYIFANMSSLMFRREPVMRKLGFWDSVRFGADGEFKKRLKIVFGKEAVVDLKTGPFSFQRQSSSSLTGSEVFGYHGFFMGARKEYLESYSNYHQKATSLYYGFPQEKRPYPVPEPMLPSREVKKNARRHFDVIIASEFRLLGGTNMSNIEEIKAQQKMGLRTGLIQMARYDLNSIKEINPSVRELINGDDVQMLVYGEKVSCDVLIVRHPPVLQAWQKYIPDIQANHVRVIVNQPPKREYSKNGKTLYSIPTCVKHLEQYVGKKGKWYPIGPLIRDTLHAHHEKDLKSIRLASEDWVNIIDVDEWQRKEKPHNKRIKIGRHSRDQYVKWPEDPRELKMIYPDKKAYEIHVLGGAKTPEKLLGKLPKNWYVQEFGEVHPKDFLADLDVFVYYTHPKWVEAFGRVIFEAMAAGVPVIIPPNYKDLFKEAAIYARPEEVQDRIHELINDKEAYATQVEKATNYVEKQFGYTKHASRLEECFVNTNKGLMR